jgi:hypothetical protein
MAQPANDRWPISIPEEYHWEYWHSFGEFACNEIAFYGKHDKNGPIRSEYFILRDGTNPLPNSLVKCSNCNKKVTIEALKIVPRIIK